MAENIDELENFDKIENAGKLENQISLSNVYSIKVGGFGKNQLKTYISSITLNDLEKDIQFYETLSKDKSWPVSQIIQREVDKRRVSSISKDYILGKGRVVKYFPPIIIALLPKGDEDKIELKYTYNNTDSDCDINKLIYEKSNFRNNDGLKPIFLKGNNKSIVDGFYLLEVSKVFDFNVICWDKSKYFAIVIDGQHRLDALIKSKSENPDIGNYVQDVVFVDFSYLVKESDNKHTPVELVRRVFIDINTNAKRVGVVRQILMDDKDLASLFVQSLVDSVNKDGTDKNSSKFLRSQIVDWYGDSLKHNLPHITGILSLYQILSDYLIQHNISSIDSLRKPKLVDKWVKRMNDCFFVDREISNEAKYENYETLGKSMNRFIKDIDFDLKLSDEDLKETSLFSFDYGVLEVAQNTFENIYSESLVKIFEELLPYKETIQIINFKRGFDPESLLSVALLSSNPKIKANATLRESLLRIRQDIEEKLNNKYYLIFTVLGQKSLFSIYFKSVFRNVNGDFTNEKCVDLTDLFITDINELLTICNSGNGNPFGKKDEFLLKFDSLANTKDLDGCEIKESNEEVGDNDYESNEDLIQDLGAIITNFWEGIIYENNNIIYNSQGIASLSNMIDFMLVCIKKLKAGKDITDEPFNIAYMSVRTRRIIQKRFNLEQSELANEVIKRKGIFIKDYLTNAYQKYAIL